LGPKPSWNRRLLGAIGRRTRSAWRRLRGRPLRPSPTEAALAWLLRRSTSEGVRTAPQGDELSSELTRLCLPTVRACGHKALAATWEQWLATQPEDPPWPPFDRGQPTPEGLARHALHSYELGDRAEGDWAMRRLVAMQRASGGFGTQIRAIGAGWLRQPESVPAVKFFLDASLKQVQSAFGSSTAAPLPSDIAEQDGRYVAVRQWLACFATPTEQPLADDLLVADVGCGSGRFLKRLVPEFPQVKLLGIDPSAELLAQLPAEAHGINGNLLDIPAVDGAFAGVFSVEALEHSLFPANGVSELCRVTRPGGQILIIDKHARKQGLSEHEPWERWFKPEEVSAWLEPWCDEVRVEPIAHARAKRPTGLFLCWTARRRNVVG
jgi:SAM-dependent methyltransferase